MTKILNLDELESASDKTLVLNKVSHSFVPFSVGQFVDQLKEMETYSARADVPVHEYLDHMVKMVGNAFPTIDHVELRKLDLHKIRKIVSFIRGELEAEVIEGLSQVDPAAADAAKNAEGKST